MRARWRSLSLRTQITLLTTTVLIVLLFVVGASVYFTTERFLYLSVAAQLRDQSQPLIVYFWGDQSTASWPGPPQIASPTAEETSRLRTMARMLAVGGTSVVIYRPDGAVIARFVGTSGSAPARAPSVPQASVPPLPMGAGAADEETATAPTRPARDLGPRDIPPLMPIPESLSGIPAPRPIVLEWEELAPLLSGADEVRLAGEPNREYQMLVLWPLYSNGRVIAIVQAATLLWEAHEVLHGLQVMLFVASMLASLAAAGLTFWLARSLLRPLAHVVAVSQQVSRGDLDARTGIAGRNEVGILGASFDTMVSHLQAILAARRRFVADAAHELRTPLTALGGMLEMLMLGAIDDPERQRHAFQRMNGEIERMARLVDDLLTLSRLDTQPLLARAPVDLVALASESVAMLCALDADHRVELEAGEPVIVSGDADRLRQVFVNLLENARKYTPAGGTIRVLVERRGAAVRVQVEDTGIGIPPEDVGRVWERFYRVDQARTRASGGSGLGLAIVKSIVEAHGGEVALSSVVGEGTTVTLSLHAAPAT